MSEYIYQSHGEPLVNERGEIYLARAGEIVRCRDCRLQDEFKYCERLGFKVGDYGYCAWPIRKD